MNASYNIQGIKRNDNNFRFYGSHPHPNSGFVVELGWVVVSMCEWGTGISQSSGFVQKQPRRSENGGGPDTSEKKEGEKGSRIRESGQETFRWTDSRLDLWLPLLTFFNLRLVTSPLPPPLHLCTIINIQQRKGNNQRRIYLRTEK